MTNAWAGSVTSHCRATGGQAARVWTTANAGAYMPPVPQRTCKQTSPRVRQFRPIPSAMHAEEKPL
jgi:hypothetical protein